MKLDFSKIDGNYQVKFSSQFKKDYNMAIKRGYKIEKLQEVIALLSLGKKLPVHNRDHSLSGKYTGYHECHIEPNWLLIYRIDKNNLELLLFRTGSHSELFGI